MKRCQNCVLPETFPHISFSPKGVCAYCEAHRSNPDTPRQPANVGKKFHELLDLASKAGGHYHAVIAYSGGKDSTYLLKLLTERYRLRLLALTLDNGFLSDTAVSNIQNVTDALGVDRVTMAVNKALMSKIITCSMEEGIYPESLLKFGSAICISCIRLVANAAIRLALEKKASVVFIGNSPGQILKTDNEIIYRDNTIPGSLKRKLFQPLADRIGDDVRYYFMLDSEECRTPGFPYTVNPYPIIGYDEETIYREIAALGWKRPADVDPTSTNCRLNSLGIMDHLTRFGFHPYEFEVSKLVRLGLLSREEAIRRVEPDLDALRSRAEQARVVLRECDVRDLRNR